jgi:hypothetical protein
LAQICFLILSRRIDSRKPINGRVCAPDRAQVIVVPTRFPIDLTSENPRAPTLVRSANALESRLDSAKPRHAARQLVGERD